jgi:putative colanic acid biosynthesis UDP-glucose lipid carrier transferase
MRTIKQLNLFLTQKKFFKSLKIFYEIFPVLSIQQTTLHEPVNKLFKRFLILFFTYYYSRFLSWLVPILALLIKLESRGPVFLNKEDPALTRMNFFCYKFRSMKINKTTEMETSKNDPRVTRIEWELIRKTSIDEMPQF